VSESKRIKNIYSFLLSLPTLYALINLLIIGGNQVIIYFLPSLILGILFGVLVSKLPFFKYWPIPKGLASVIIIYFVIRLANVTRLLPYFLLTSAIFLIVLNFKLSNVMEAIIGLVAPYMLIIALGNAILLGIDPRYSISTILDPLLSNYFLTGTIPRAIFAIGTAAIIDLIIPRDAYLREIAEILIPASFITLVTIALILHSTCIYGILTIMTIAGVLALTLRLILKLR